MMPDGYLSDLTRPWRHPQARAGNDILASLDDTTTIADVVQADGSVAPSAIKSLKMTISNACNFGCRHCGRDPNAPRVVISEARFRDIARQAAALGIGKFGLFFDGESTLAPRTLLRCVEVLREEGIEYPFLTTNGTAAGPKMVEALIRAGLKSLKWSVNAHPGLFTTLTGKAPELLDVTVRNIRDAWHVRERLHQMEGLDCSLSASSILFNARHPQDMRPWLERNVYPWVDTHYWLDEYSMGGGDAVTHMAGLGEPIRGNSGRHGNQRSAMPCWAPINSLHIAFGPDFDGTHGSLLLYACCFPTGQEGHVMANLNVMWLAEAINSERFRALRLAHVRNEPIGTPCEGCVTGVWG